MDNYRIFRSSHYSVNSNPLLAIGILDCASRDRLEEVVSWFVGNMDYDLHVITRFDGNKIAELQEKYPTVTFIAFSSMAFSGDMVNSFASECKSNYFLIIRSDLDLIRFDGDKLFSMMEKKEHPAMVCAVLANSRKEIVPCVRRPLYEGGKLSVGCQFPNMKDDTKMDTLYPVMALGLYDRALFQRLRGYDEMIHSEYWQVLDWGIRCWLFGYPLYLTQALLFQFPNQLSLIEDLTVTEGYDRCITKALSIHQNGGKNVVSKPPYGYDKEVLRDEVKTRMLWLVKQDYPHLVSTWVGTE